MKRSNDNSTANASVWSATFLALGIGFTAPAQAADEDPVVVTVAAVEQDVFFSTAPEPNARSDPKTNTAPLGNDAQPGAFANEPKWRRRVFESN